MVRLLHPFVIRHLLRHKLIALFDILSVAVGVSVFLAIQSANYSAQEAFRAGIDLTSGKSHLEIRGADGSLPEAWFLTAQSLPGIAAATPVLEGYLVLPGFPGRYLHLVGADPFTQLPFQTAAARSSALEGPHIEGWLSRPGQILIHPALAAELTLAPGDPLLVEIDGRQENLVIAGFLAENDTGSEISSNLAVMDIGWAQELLNRPGRLTSVQLLLRDPQRLQDVMDSLRRDFATAEGLVIQPPSRRSAQVQRMLQGFQLNLTALSMVSILVGVFLIYNTVSASAVRRRLETGILRSTGASRRQVLLLFLSEGLLVGFPGIVLGIPLGLGLAKTLIGEVASTVSSHYLLLSISQPVTHPAMILQAVAFGFGATLAGALHPALEAAHLPPLHALYPRKTAPPRPSKRPHASWRLPALGLSLLGGSVLLSLLALSPGPPWLSFAACFCLVAGFASLAPILVRLFAFAFRSLARGDSSPATLWRLACDQLHRSLSRSSVTVAALMTALSMTIGVSVMVSSFRSTVNNWVESFMQADLFVTPASNEITGFHSFLPSEMTSFLEQHAAVRHCETYRQHELTLPGDQTIILATVGNPSPDALSFVEGSPREILQSFARPDHVLVTEPLARRLGLRRGQSLSIPTPQGIRPFSISGVYYDYSDDRGKALLTRENYHLYWDDPRIHSLAITLMPSVSPAEFREELRQTFSSSGQLALYLNRDLRDRVLHVFDQTFAVTYVLRSISILVACLGIGLSLTTLVMERTRDIGVLRSLGASRSQVRALYLVEGGLLGAISSLIGAACGLGMAVILTAVVNRAFFGWTIHLRIPWHEVALTPCWVIPAALLAAWLPAARAAALPVVAAVREV